MASSTNEPMDESINEPFTYGRATFQTIRAEKLYFADNSKFIRSFEGFRADHLLYCRPPRFGKSLLLSMVEAYYDESEEARNHFEWLFAGRGDTDIYGDKADPPVALKIGTNPTALQGKYKVLSLNLCIAASRANNVDVIEARLNRTVNSSLRQFKRKYHLTFEIDQADCLASLQDMAAELSESPRNRLLILIDEFDRYANRLLFDNDPECMAKLAPLEALFEKIKNLGTYLKAVRYRSLIVGVLPIALNAFSTWNVCIDVSMDEAFANALGFTEQHVKDALTACGLTSTHVADVLKLLRAFMNGYYFFESSVAMFNPQFVVHFVGLLRRNDKFKHMVLNTSAQEWNAHQVNNFIKAVSDPNVQPGNSAYNAVERLGGGGGEECLKEAIGGGNDVTALLTTFQGRLKLDVLATQRDALLRFMYHQGLLTLNRSISKSDEASSSVSAAGDPANNELLIELRVPNDIVRREHMEVLLTRLQHRDNVLVKALTDTTEETMHNLLWTIVSNQGTPHSDNFIENGLQAELEAGLRQMCTATGRASGKPSVHSEYQRNDLFLRDADNKHIILIELKRVKPGQVQLTVNRIQEQYIRVMPDGKKTYVKIAFGRFRVLTAADTREMMRNRVLMNGEFADGETVHALELHAAEQLRLKEVKLKETVGDYAEWKFDKFAVVQVGWPLLVTKVD